MPRYTANPTFGAAIPVAANDLIQNTGRYMVFVCGKAEADDDDSLELLPGKGHRIATAGNIRIRAAGTRPGEIKVIGGL